MELSTATMTTAPPTSKANQPGTNFVSINTANNNINRADARPLYGNDSPQSQMQKQLATNILETTVTDHLAKDNSNQRALVKNGDSILNKISNDHTKSATVDASETVVTSVIETNAPDITITMIKCIDIDVKVVLDSLLNVLDQQPEHSKTATSGQSSSLFVNNDDPYSEITSFVMPIGDEEEDETKPKDIVTLRNLELTPPPLEDPVQTPETTNRREKKRTYSQTTIEPNQGTEGRSKRQRKQTQLFQVVDTKEIRRESRGSFISMNTPKSRTASSCKKQIKQSTTTRSHRSPTPSTQQAHTQVSQIPPDVIFYEKNDYLAIRNEENSFYLCQLTENVRVEKPAIKIKWLDTRNGGKTYFLTSHYDKIPQKSIIMPVILTKMRSEKKGEQLFLLDEQAKESIMERLKKSINLPSESE